MIIFFFKYRSLHTVMVKNPTVIMLTKIPTMRQDDVVIKRADEQGLKV